MNGPRPGRPVVGACCLAVAEGLLTGEASGALRARRGKWWGRPGRDGPLVGVERVDVEGSELSRAPRGGGSGTGAGGNTPGRGERPLCDGHRVSCPPLSRAHGPSGTGGLSMKRYRMVLAS